MLLIPEPSPLSEAIDSKTAIRIDIPVVLMSLVSLM